LYYSLFHSHLTYGIEIWSCVPPSHLKQLISKQKTAIRIISNSSYNAHTEPIFKSLAILPLSNLITISNLKTFHSFVYNLTPTAFSDTWLTTIEQRHNDNQIHLLYNLRNNDDYFVPLSRSLTLSRFPLYNLPTLWNSLAPHVRAIPIKHIFTSSVKKQLLDNLSFQPNCTRLLCPACTRINP
jgi:hypothetical protein